MKNKYSIQYTTRFKKQYKKVISNSKYKEDFRKVVTMLANDDVLPEKYHNHLLEPKSYRFMGMSH